MEEFVVNTLLKLDDNDFIFVSLTNSGSYQIIQEEEIIENKKICALGRNSSGLIIIDVGENSRSDVLKRLIVERIGNKKITEVTISTANLQDFLSFAKIYTQDPDKGNPCAII